MNVSLYPILMLLHADALRMQGRSNVAIGYYRTALTIQPELVSAYNGLSLALIECGQNEAALSALHKAIALKPDYAIAYNNLGTALKTLGRLDEAIVAFQTSRKLRPQAALVHNNLGTALKDRGQLSDAIASFRQAIRLDPTAVTAHSNLLYTMYFHPDYSGRAIYEEHMRWNEQHAKSLTVHALPHTNDRSPDRRLRIGYVSPDFRHHVQAHFTLPVIQEHHRREYQIYCYANTRQPDDVTVHFSNLADGWRTIANLSDEQVAHVIRGDGIDVLVDLTMHMAGARPLIFARKPSPVQVTWLAYPGTTGMSAMDYRLSDPHLDPPGLCEDHYCETTVRLPETFWCYAPMADEPHVSPLPALQHGRITFCCLNNFCKINERVLKLWARVMHKVTPSHLMILTPPGDHRKRLLDVLGKSGIAASRIAFFEARPRPAYLSLYQQADIALDTFPANGHTTTMDALWMGLPVVTLAGETAISRGAKSILHNLGRPEWVANDESGYVKKVFALAADLSALASLRAQLREQLQRSPILDAPRFTRHLEHAYRTMWQSWCASLQKDHDGGDGT